MDHFLAIQCCLVKYIKDTKTLHDYNVNLKSKYITGVKRFHNTDDFD